MKVAFIDGAVQFLSIMHPADHTSSHYYYQLIANSYSISIRYPHLITLSLYRRHPCPFHEHPKKTISDQLLKPALRC